MCIRDSLGMVLGLRRPRPLRRLPHPPRGRLGGRALERARLSPPRQFPRRRPRRHRTARRARAGGYRREGTGVVPRGGPGTGRHPRATPHGLDSPVGDPPVILQRVPLAVGRRHSLVVVDGGNVLAAGSPGAAGGQPRHCQARVVPHLVGPGLRPPPPEATRSCVTLRPPAPLGTVCAAVRRSPARRPPPSEAARRRGTAPSAPGTG